MEPKRRGRPPKKVDNDLTEVVNKIPEVVNEVPRGTPIETRNMTDNAVIKLTLSMPGHAEKDFTLTIRNLKGNIMPNKLNPDEFIKIIKELLSKGYPGVL